MWVHKIMLSSGENSQFYGKIETLTFKEEKVYSGSTESFGKQWAMGDVVGVFLDLIDKTISKYRRILTGNT